MKLFHGTTEENVKSILRDGFLGGTYILGEPRVWFCDEIDGADAYGETILCVDVPDKIAGDYRLYYEDVPEGRCCPGGQREYAFPSDVINEYSRVVVSTLTEAEQATVQPA